MSKPKIYILIVEDDLVDRMACRRALAQDTSYEFVLSEAETGRDGLQLALVQNPDCVLLDHNLPDMNGLEFLDELRKDQGEMSVPVMMLTGTDNVSVAVEAMKRGAQDYLIKDANRQYLELLPLVIQRVLRERRALTEKKQSAEHYRQLFDEAIDAIALADAETGELIDLNHAMEHLTGWRKAEIIGKPQKMLHPFEPGAAQVHSGFAQHRSDRGGQMIETQLITKGGMVRDVEIKASPLNMSGRKVLLGFFRDVTERMAAEARIERLTKLYQALSEVNQAIVRMDDKSALFPLVCRLAVDLGGVRMAWIGQLNEANGLIEPLASYGNGIEYLKGIVISSKQYTPEGSGPSSIAFRENRNLIINNFQTSELTLPWQERALRYDLRSSGSFPIFRAGKPFAVFTVYHAQADAFDAEMIGLLDEMAHDISFALDSFDRENVRRQAQEALLDSERHFRAYFERSMVGMAATSPEKGLLEVNETLCAMLGYTREELLRLTWAGLTHPDDLAANAILHNQILSGEIGEYTMDKRYIRKDGTIIYAFIAVRALRRADGSIDYMVVLIEDLTERKQAEQELAESSAQLRGLTARREETREEERRYIAREVHDELGQILTGLQLNISVITHKFAADLPALHEHLQETMLLTNSALSATRNVASALRPTALDMGIVSAIEWLAGRFGLNTGIHCEVHIGETEVQLDENRAIALFRIIQESLTNVARHAQANRVDIFMDREADDFVLKVHDNGIGFDMSAKKIDSFGLVGIRERAFILAGTVFINSQSGSGTEIVVRIPINNGQRAS